MRFLLLGCLIASSLVVQESRACFCFSTPLCNQLPGPHETRTIFVGTVTEIYPASLAYRSLESALNKRDRGALVRAKAMVLRLWGPVLSADEARKIKLASSQDDLRRAWGMGMFPRRVRFRVGEWIEGKSGEAFELFTDASDCGYRFEAGKQYLVVSWQYKGKTNLWWTGACSRTAPVGSEMAKQDLKALRAWRDGQPLSPRIYGGIIDWRHRRPSDPVSPGPPDFVIRLAAPHLIRKSGPNRKAGSRLTI
jgi:hypothetical protein